MPPKRTLTIARKKRIAGRQNYKCANSPDRQLTGLENHKCILWQLQESNQGIFDESGYEIDHIIEHSISENDSDENLQALCVSCHRVKTARFNSNKRKENKKNKDPKDIKDIKDNSITKTKEKPKIKKVNTKKTNIKEINVKKTKEKLISDSSDSSDSSDFTDSSDSLDLIHLSNPFNKPICFHHYFGEINGICMGCKQKITQTNSLFSSKSYGNHYKCKQERENSMTKLLGLK